MVHIYHLTENCDESKSICYETKLFLCQSSNKFKISHSHLKFKNITFLH